MSGTGPNNNGQMNAQNFLMQQQFAQQQQQQQGTPFPAGGFAGNNPQQQRMLQLQIQQQQMQIQQIQQQQQQLQSTSQQPGTRSSSSTSPMPNNPMAPAPASLARPLQVMASTSSSSGASIIARMNSSAGATKSKGQNAKPTAHSLLGRATSNATASVPGPPTTTLKLATSSMPVSASIGASNANGPATELQIQQLLGSCDWKDKTLWVSRQLLGGNATNGFLRATATVQRIKRQRARQTAQSKKKLEAAEAKDDDSTAPAPAPPAPAAANKDKDNNDDDKEAKKEATKKRDTPDQASEEILKNDIMNPRTAKKLKAELQDGLAFCVTLQNTIRTIIMEMDPKIAAYTPLPLHQGGEIPALKSAAGLPGNYMRAAAGLAGLPNRPTSKAPGSGPLARPPSDASRALQQRQRRASVDSSAAKSTAVQASPGGPGGSTLRKNRKKKLPPSNEKTVALSEFEASGKRAVSKKEHNFRLFEVIRFRALTSGDFVAARVSSRDLWILARVQKNFPGFSLPPSDFLKLSEARRDAHFRDKVAIKDVEDKDGGINMVQRNLVLPLPRTFSEAAEWCQRSKKGSRVYAMYPHTTSLYSATVIDNTTYCRQDDDIIVVEFDGDEADPTGVLPKYHIPARFVTLIPREFPAAQTNSKKRKSVTSAQASLLPNASNALGSPQSAKRESLSHLAGEGLLQEDALGGMVSDMNFSDLQMSTDSLEDFGFDFTDE